MMLSMSALADGQDDRPWENPGAIRRDAEPHRGLSLVCLGLGSQSCAVIAAAISFIGANNHTPIIEILFILPCALGLLSAMRILCLAGQDLSRMRANEVDPQGRSITLLACDTACLSIILTHLPRLVARD